MVKEFQQLRKQMTQILLENHQCKKEAIESVTKEREEKEKLFVDLIKLIEQLTRKKEVAIKASKLAATTNQNLSETYNNITNDLTQLLAAYNVHPIIGQELVEGSSVFQKKKYSYQGKILNE